jgi:hypothetical protein
MEHASFIERRLQRRRLFDAAAGSPVTLEIGQYRAECSAAGRGCIELF